MKTPTRGVSGSSPGGLVAGRLEVITNHHGSIHSIYFRDPVNDIRLEIPASIAANWNAKETSARVALDEVTLDLLSGGTLMATPWEDRSRIEPQTVDHFCHPYAEPAMAQGI